VGRDQPLDRVLLWVRCAIKSWERLETISHHRRGLRGILDASPDLQQLQPVGNLLDTVLHQLVTLLGGSGGIVATLNHGMLLTLEDQELVKVAAGAGRYAQAGRLRNLPPRIHAFIQRAIQSSSVLHEPGRIALPLELRGQHLGAIYIETETWPGDGEDLLMVYANQVAIALENSRLYELATIDSLTGLYRRLHLFQRMREVLKTAGRAGGSVGLIVLDLDRFKSVNDTYGHPAGDRVLASIGRTLRGALRDSDVAARTGGEEFAVLLLGVGDKEAAIVAERVRTAIENTPVLADGRTLRVTASLGVATVAPEGRLDSDTADDLGATLYAAADRGVYAAKNAGGNRAMMVVPGDATQAA